MNLNKIKTFFAGIAVGMANVIPGVSGGTIMVITGIFNRLTDAISGVFKFKNPNRLKDLLYILEVLIGVGIGIGAFVILIPLISKHFFAQLMVFFIGLILVSGVFFMKKEIGEQKNFHLLFALAGILAVFVIVALSPAKGKVEVDFLPLSFGLLISQFLLGLIAGSTMIFPGISGSMVMLILDKYYLFWGYMKSVFSNFSLDILFPFFAEIIGLGLGVILGAKLVKFLLKKWKYQTLSLITGLLFGSIFALLPFGKNIPSDAIVVYDLVTILTTIVCFLLGCSFVYFLEKLMKKLSSKLN